VGSLVRVAVGDLVAWEQGDHEKALAWERAFVDAFEESLSRFLCKRSMVMKPLFRMFR